jgi:NAD(P)-dependent dehydrogenase (short-subunit alcohol dehydrogenase family)
VTISSTGGIVGQAFVSAYSASKFGVEGWMESLAPEVEPFGIRTMLVDPGFFRTELLTEDSTNYPKPSIDDYAEKTRETVTAWKGMSGQQTGDPAKLADALMQLIAKNDRPFRWPAVRTPSRRSRRKDTSSSIKRTRTANYLPHSP